MRRVLFVLTCAALPLALAACAPKESESADTTAPPAAARPTTTAQTPPPAPAAEAAKPPAPEASESATKAETKEAGGKEAGKETPGKMTKTASGLQYQDVVVGKGPTPKPGQRVTVNYVGTLQDGTKFDSSLDHGRPFSFNIGEGNVIKGWDEGVMTMHVGGKRKLIIPPDLAYGDNPRPGGPIPPGATLLFDVELLKVE